MICKQCGNKYTQIGLHWAQSSCDYPSLSQHQHDILTGLLMGDGYISHQGRNPYIGTQMVTKEYLNYIDSKLDICSNGVDLHVTGEQQESYQSDFTHHENEGNYQDQYQFRTRSLPCLQRYAEWYESGTKVIPRDINLNETTFLHWYVCDGYFTQKKYIGISMTDEADNTDKISYWMDQLPCDVSWHSVTTNRYGNTKRDIRFDKEASQKLFSFMEKSESPTPLPGFVYKWPEEYRNI